MNEIQRSTSSTFIVPLATKEPANKSEIRNSATADAATTDAATTDADTSTVTISTDSVYVLEVDRYLSTLDKDAQHKALAFLSQSNDPIHQRTANHFRQAQETLLQAFGSGQVALSGPDRATRKASIDQDAVVDKDAFALRPDGVGVFRLDGNKDFISVRHTGYNQVGHDELDLLEKNEGNKLSNRDQANVFGSVRNALVYSENILLSFDDVLHYNYSIEKAKTAIDFINPPAAIKAALEGILAKSIKYQDEKQSRVLTEATLLTGNTNVGQTAKNTVHLGSAAQNYNRQLQSELIKTDRPLLNSHTIINKLLYQNTELIRFTPDKLEEAMEFYRTDYEQFQRALNGDFATTHTRERTLEVVQTELDQANDNALSIINILKNYLSIPE